MREPQEILDAAIEAWEPVQIVCLFSGGYDSMCATHVAHRLDTHGIPMSTWAIDTKLSADGWKDFVRGVAEELNFKDFNIADNEKGFRQFVESVRMEGCPRTRPMHTFVYQKLKERAIDAIHMRYKRKRRDKTLFVSGMRRAESAARKDSEEYSRVGKSNKIFCAPIVYWSNKEVAEYRISNDLPENPFYSTVKGSGDCQCNWGNFITIGTLKKYSPELAAGNVALIDAISKELHGYGWDGEIADQVSFGFPGEPQDTAELTSPFLCAGCSRSKNQHSEVEEFVMMQRGLF